MMSGKILSGSAAILIVALFFLPWVTVSCNGVPIGEFSGYELATGRIAGDDLMSQLLGLGGYEGDPTLFLIPATAVLALLLLGLSLREEAWSTRAAWGQIGAALLTFVVLLLRWFVLPAQEDVFFDIAIRPPLWGTAVGLLAVMGGGMLTLLLPDGKAAPGPEPAYEIAYEPGAAPTGQPRPRTPPAGIETYLEQVRSAADAPPPAAALSDSQRSTVMDTPPRPASASAQGERTAPETPRKPVTPTAGPGDPPPKPAPASLAETVIEAQLGPALGKTEVLPPVAAVPRLVIVKGPQTGRQFQLTALATHIGRAPGNQILLEDTAVSTHHAHVTEENGRYVLTDQRSTNGTFLYDARRKQWLKIERTELADGAQIRLGRTVLEFKAY